MSKAKVKTINLLLEDGDLNGVMCIEDSSWNTGELYSAPRDSVEDLLSSNACDKFGVYLLLSEDLVYVGQSSNLSSRIKQHIIGKDWWVRVIILTTKDNNLNRSDIDFLEAMLIKKAASTGQLDADNKNRGITPKVDRFRQVVLEQYLEEAYFLLELIGITVFCEKKDKKSSKLISSIVKNSKKEIEIRAKKEAIDYVTEQGVLLETTTSYAKLSEGHDDFWINPRTHVLTKPWSIVLNDVEEHELIILNIPSNAIKLSSGKKDGLFVRNDRPELLEIKIKKQDFLDRKSGVDFSEFVVSRIKY